MLMRKQQMLTLVLSKCNTALDALNESKSCVRLKFQYRGRTSHLGSPAEIAAWIAERRKRWPSKARIAEKEREARERQDQHAALLKKPRKKNLERDKGSQVPLPKNISPSKLSSSGETRPSDTSDTSSILSDSGPDEEPSKQQTTSPEHTSPMTTPRPTDICRFYNRKGGCKYGKKCRDRHERLQPRRENQKVQKPGMRASKGRMTLHQRVCYYPLIKESSAWKVVLIRIHSLRNRRMKRFSTCQWERSSIFPPMGSSTRAMETRMSQWMDRLLFDGYH